MEEFKGRLLDCLLRIITERKSIEVLSNLLTFGRHNCMAGIPRKAKGSICCKEFVGYFAGSLTLLTAGNLTKLFSNWFAGKEAVGEQRLYFMFKPVILQDEPIGRSHMVQDTPEMFVRMLLEASIKKMRLREQLTRLVKDPASLPVFRNLFADEKGLVELKKVIKLFDGVKLSKLQFQLFIVEFFEQEKATIEEFLNPYHTVAETFNDTVRGRTISNGASGSPQSRTSIVVINNYPPSDQEPPFTVPINILELFCSYFSMIADKLPELRKRTKKFMDQYDRSKFQQQMTTFYHGALKVMDSRFTESFLRSGQFKLLCPALSQLDMKEFLFVMAELKPQASNKCLRMFFSRHEQDGVLSLDKLYGLLCEPTDPQPCNSQPGESLVQLLECILNLEEYLEDIRQRIAGRNNNYLVALFNTILTNENPSYYSEATQITQENLANFLSKHASKQPSKNSLRRLWERLFPQMDTVTLRRFSLHFLANQ